MAVFLFSLASLVIISVTEMSADRFKVKLRNAHTQSKCAGIVEQLEQSKWKPLCGKPCWTDKNADVTCKELRCGGGIIPESKTSISSPTMVRYGCKGNEKELNKCQKTTCFSDDACQVGAEVLCQGAVRLNNHNNISYGGRVEVFNKKQSNEYEWRGLCKECWSQNNTHVVCKQFGFRYGELHAGTIDEESPRIWDQRKYTCSGNEDDLSDCTVTQECKECQRTSVVVTCSNKAVDYNKTCKSEHSCKDTLICKNKVCTCEKEKYWNEDRSNCTNKPGFNETCSDKTGCIDGLVCTNVGDHVCRCKDETNTYWNSDEKTCKNRTGYGQKCETRISNSCRKNLMCRLGENETTCLCRKDEVFYPSVNICIKTTGYNTTCKIQENCKYGLTCKNKICTCANEETSFWYEDEKKCFEKPSFNETCSDKTGCVDGLVCTNVDHLCRCKDETDTYWNSDVKSCQKRLSVGEDCRTRMDNTCKDSLVCKDGPTGTICRCNNDEAWSAKEKKCTKKSSINGSCESHDHCIRNLVCKGTGNRLCKCGTNAEVWNSRTGQCEQRSFFTAVFVTMVKTFKEAKNFCVTNFSGNLASSDEIRQLFSACVMNDTIIWLDNTSQWTEQDQIYEATYEQLCPFGIQSSGVLNETDRTNCSEAYSFLCVSNGYNSTNSSKSCVPSIGPESVDKEEIILTRSGSLFSLILVVLAISVLAAVTLAVLCIKRRKKKKSKHGRQPEDMKDLSYSAAVVGNEYSLSNLTANGTHGNAPGQNGESTNGDEGVYSLAAQPDFSNPTSSKTVVTDHYGYGVLGGKRVDNDDGGMYSHTVRVNDKGEYDSFVKRDRDKDTDVNDLYDHTRALMMESEYDEIQKRK